ncbi:MAG: PD40 domain-containing protein [Proteobacteria bacterium]|nr:PD40 domain-containing protein [Pseudomonadota bacterium]
MPRRLTELAFDKSAVRWSSDGRTIYFSGDENQRDESTEGLTRDIWAVRVTDGSVTNLTPEPGSATLPSPSPDGTRLAFIFTAGRGAEQDLMIADVGGGGGFETEPVNLTEGWDLVPGAPEWSADGTAILFSAAVGGNRHLFRVPAVGGPVVQVTEGDRRLTSVSLSDRGHVMAYAATDAVSPTELYVARGDGTAERQATEFNRGWMEGITLVPPERLTWLVGDSIEVEGWVIKPVGHTSGRKYPLILKIHGGPHGAYGNTFFPTFHVLSAAGFFVLYTNPRGSNGYGHEFRYATRGQWGVMDSEGRWIRADFGNLTVISLYLPSGSSKQQRQQIKYQTMDYLQPVLEAMVAGGREYIICGDWNIAHKKIDIKNWRSNQKNSGFLPEERAWLSDVFDRVGFVDAFRAVDQREQQYTWWSNRGQSWAKNVGWRIDYQIVTPGLIKSIRSASIFKQERFSDHAPLIMDYDFDLALAH